MSATTVPRTLSANEAACVTGVPLRQVHRIIDAGLLGSAAARRERSRTVHCDGLVSLKLAHETTAIFTVDGRRRLVRYLLGHPEAETARVHDVSVDVRSIRDEVREGLSRLARARETITADDAVRVAGELVALTEEHRRIATDQNFGRYGWPLLDLLAEQPLVTIKYASARLGSTPTTVGRLLDQMTSSGIVSELTGRERYRVYRYSPFLDVLVDDSDRN